MNTKFKSEIEDIEVTGIELFHELQQIEFEIEKSKLFVEWELDIDSRNYGIKDFGTAIIEIYGPIEWTCDIEFLSEMEIEKLVALGGTKYDYKKSVDGRIDISSKQNFKEKEWTINNEIEIGSTIYPTRIEIDFKEMTILIGN